MTTILALLLMIGIDYAVISYVVCDVCKTWNLSEYRCHMCRFGKWIMKEIKYMKHSRH